MAPGGHEPDHVGDPVPIGLQGEHRRAAAAQRLRHLLALGSGRGREIGTQRGGHAELAGAARFGIVQHHVAAVGQREVQGIEHLHGQQVVAGGDRAQRALPVDVAEEIADHHGQTAFALRTAQRLDPGLEITAHAVAGVRGGRDAAQQRLGVHASAARGDANQVLTGRHDGADPVAAARR